MSSSSSVRSRGGHKGTWEDDAWKIDSDDDEFKASQTKGSSSILSNGSRKNNKQQSGIAAGSSSSSLSRQHAPPARPHLFPMSSDRSASSSRDIPEPKTKLNRASPERKAKLSSSVSSATQNGWTLIERTSSRDSAAASASGASPSPGPEVVAEVKRGSEVEAKEMLEAIREDVDDVLRDPTLMLSRLSITGKPRQVSRSSSYSHQEGDTSMTASSSRGVQSPLSQTSNDIEGVITTNNGEKIFTAIPSTMIDATETAEGGEAIALPEGMLERRNSIRSERRRAKFIECLNEDIVQMDKLRSLAWAGVPDEMRPMIWMLLLGYLPAAKTARASTMARKRAEYQSGVRLAFQRGNDSLDQAIWHQIHIDVPRTNPGIALWQREATQRALERILYVWAIRHPASGYVQGINDIATPFFQVFLSAYITSDVELYDVALLPPAALEALEADTFWCLSKLLDGIQDNYIFAQPGIQRQVRRMGELVGRINPPLHGHLEEQGVEYMQFAFRWMNCLLMRELSVRNIVRMWDTYLAEGPDAFSDFHLYVCSSFLNRWDDELRRMDFQGIIMFLQSLPTQKWSAKETELLLADAFVKKSLFGGTAHLTN